ncbi:nuclear transport factor 2 family protein [Urechidicola vernalis]|uniref:Nuclear transport factor 2 family protein n=1 Tax=Urechidicola vernalis TaxID=3075600 RepID=A0ABU2Y193_9FLAO|nr:nuclear transport factor 2 family protein [Urechidicola sp. P050]MDT0551964.1 nuclear transport factor 2 family protein [Urechidicola sp. P050]
MNYRTYAILLLTLCVSLVTFSQNSTDKHYRHLRYNHVSPYIKLAGIYPISAKEALNSSHYTFTYNKQNQLTEVTNYHYATERRHPLASIGAYKTVITYNGNQETRVYLYVNGERVPNDRAVFKEIFTLDKKGNYAKLEFYDLDDNPMESNWGISNYTWKSYKKMIIEQRFNLKGEAKNLSSYFEFGTTGMTFRNDGTPIGKYNLNEDFEIVNNSAGVASYQDTYDENGNHVKYTYHNKEDDLVINPSGLAIGIKIYDDKGNYIKQQHLDTNGKLLRERDVPNNQNIRLSSIASKKDSLEIKRIALGYLKALQELNPVLMDEVLNDSLNKVTIGFNRSIRKEVVTSISREKMIENATDWNKSGTRFPPDPNNQITILDIYHRMATVKLYSDNWVEYLHLIKLDGKWTIINLLWQHKDVNRYPY